MISGETLLLFLASSNNAASQPKVNPSMIRLRIPLPTTGTNGTISFALISRNFQDYIPNDQVPRGALFLPRFRLIFQFFQDVDLVDGETMKFIVLVMGLLV